MKRLYMTLSLAVACALVPWSAAQTEKTKTETKSETKTETRNEEGKLVGEEKTKTVTKTTDEREARATFQKSWWAPATRWQKATDLMGKRVKNNAGEDIGECGELAIDPEAGRVIYAVLEFGGFLGMGEKWFAVPFSALMLTNDAKNFTMDASKESLKNAQGFDKNAKWPNFADERWATETHKFYNQPRYWEMAGDETGVYATTTRWQKASDLIGKNIHNKASNDELGDVDDLLIDPNTGRVLYALVTFDHVEGLNGQFIVPWRALSLVDDYSRFTMEMTKDQLKTAKPFDKNVNITDKNWATENARFYHVTAYWDRGTGEAGMKSERK